MLNREYDNNVAFLDILFNISLLLTFFFVALIVNQSQIIVEKNAESKAEYLITIDWTGFECDVDIYFKDPHGNLIYYKDKDQGLMSVDRISMWIFKIDVYITFKPRPVYCD